jgi:Antibiotic biosynthesis monooxygenase
MSYIFMAVHYPEPSRREEIYASMAAMAHAVSGVPGLLEIGPWLESQGDRIVGVSRWESRAAFEAAMPGSGVPNDIIHNGEIRPREYFHLIQSQPESGAIASTE